MNNTINLDFVDDNYLSSQIETEDIEVALNYLRILESNFDDYEFIISIKVRDKHD